MSLCLLCICPYAMFSRYVNIAKFRTIKAAILKLYAAKNYSGHSLSVTAKHLMANTVGFARSVHPIFRICIELN